MSVLLIYLLGVATLPALAVILAALWFVLGEFYAQRDTLIQSAEQNARWNLRVVAERDATIERLVAQLRAAPPGANGAPPEATE